jgi:hypothetical protein
MLSKLFMVSCVFAAVLSGTDPANPTVRVIEETIAKVNNEIITRTEMERQRIQIESELRLKLGLSGDELEIWRTP